MQGKAGSCSHAGSVWFCPIALLVNGRTPSKSGGLAFSQVRQACRCTQCGVLVRLRTKICRCFCWHRASQTLYL